MEKEEYEFEEDSAPSWLAWVLIAIFTALLLLLLGYYWIQLLDS